MFHIELTSLQKHAIKMVLAIALSLVIYKGLDLEHGFYLPLTIIIVLQVDLAVTLKKGLLRCLGTIVGITLGTIMIFFVKDKFILYVLLFVSLWIAFYFNQFTALNYSIFMIPINIVLVLFLEVVIPGQAYTLFLIRIFDTILGSVIAILISAIIFPINYDKLIKKSINKSQDKLIEYIYALSKYASNKSEFEQLYKARTEFRQYLFSNRQNLTSWVYIQMFNPKQRKLVKTLIVKQEVITQLLFGLSSILQDENDILKCNIIANFLEDFAKGEKLQIADVNPFLRYHFKALAMYQYQDL
tara:strand:+ start:944 stop:1843 length:900 start_codon:yes stop_codon:yes gene_type:complete